MNDRKSDRFLIGYVISGGLSIGALITILDLSKDGPRYVLVAIAFLWMAGLLSIVLRSMK